jgi:hypothetical protein
MNLYGVGEILSWKPITELDPLRALVTMQVIRVGRCGSNLPVPGEAEGLQSAQPFRCRTSR